MFRSYNQCFLSSFLLHLHPHVDLTLTLLSPLSPLRPDANIFALRWLTGGHVLKLCTEDFDWNSMDHETVGVNGMAFVEGYLVQSLLLHPFF